MYKLYYRFIVITWRDGNLSCANFDLRIRSFANWLQIELYINLLPAANTVYDTSGCKYSLLQIYLNPGVNSIYLFIFTFFAHSLREKNEPIYKFSVDRKRSVKQSHLWCASYTHLHVPLTLISHWNEYISEKRNLITFVAYCETKVVFIKIQLSTKTFSTRAVQIHLL